MKESSSYPRSECDDMGLPWEIVNLILVIDVRPEEEPDAGGVSAGMVFGIVILQSQKEEKGEEMPS